jgi:hypothetical protein
VRRVSLQPIGPAGTLAGIDLPSAARTAETWKPKEKAPATSPLFHPNSAINGDNSSEKAVRAVTAIAIVTKAAATINHP